MCAKPFVKWVGGKRSILQALQNRMPQGYHRYFECFVGGGALFFAQKPSMGYLSDINQPLITAYQAIRDDVTGVLKALEEHQQNHQSAYFLEARKSLHLEADPVKIASLFIYLNKTCFNGLYRVNRSGQFNVPMGRYRHPKIIDTANLIRVSAALQNTQIHHHDFEQTPIQQDAFYYLDPPYDQSYQAYSSTGFNSERQKDLAAFCQKIDRAGGDFMLSNADTTLIKSLYSNYR